MDKTTENIIFSYLEQSLAGLSKENPKLDFKRKWYNLKVPAELCEFLKDTTAIANTVGLDGYIIIGYDEKTLTFHDCRFKDCGISDTNEINGLINKNIDRGFTLSIEDFTFNHHNLSLIHIPPSFDKPHVIRNYKTYDKTSGAIKKEELHKIFVRKGTTISEATKYDLDFIYYDKKNIIPDYRLFISMSILQSNFIRFSDHDSYNGQIIIENSGLRPVAIINFNFILPIFTGMNEFPIQKFYFKSLNIYGESGTILNSNEIKKLEIDCRYFHNDLSYTNRLSQDELEDLNYNKEDFFSKNGINIDLTNGQTIKADVNFF